MCVHVSPIPNPRCDSNSLGHSKSKLLITVNPLTECHQRTTDLTNDEIKSMIIQTFNLGAALRWSSRAVCSPCSLQIMDGHSTPRIYLYQSQSVLACLSYFGTRRAVGFRVSYLILIRPPVVSIVYCYVASQLEPRYPLSSSYRFLHRRLLDFRRSCHQSIA